MARFVPGYPRRVNGIQSTRISGNADMKPNETPLAEEISCFRDVPDYHDSVEPYFGLDLRPGQTLDGRFLLGEPISNHGMATIFKAKDLHDHGQAVAIKVPH